MTNELNINRGDIYWIEPNPHRETYDSVNKPGRPAIIVSNQANNKHSLTYEIVYLTLSPKYDLPTHCTIRSANELSTALCEQITTVSHEQIGRYVGTCTALEMALVDSCMAISLGLDEAHMYRQERNDDEDEKVVEVKQVTEKEHNEKFYELQDEILHQQAMITELQGELIKAKAREELFRELYTEALIGKQLPF